MDVFRNIKLRRNNPANQKSSHSSKNGQTRPSINLAHAPSVEVFQNHWRQALTVIKRHAATDSTRNLTFDDVTLVMQNVERMSDILVVEEEENGQQGLCLVYLLAEDILDQLISWCLNSGVYENKIKYELLKILENLISQSLQPLLYHKPVIKPLLQLLGSCVDSGLTEIENNVILLLHQLCVCISRNPQYLELFFNVSYSSGQNNFLIFCLLIPYIHREGTLGQQARDALLLIMAASARNQVIGKYIANNSDFCPVLATGLSALYSSLPHKVRPEGHEDWYRIEKEHYLHMPDVQMIINCLEFCNAVVQVAHVLVGQQLIDYIYNGFLLPVMAPALLQSAIEEQVSAIAYLELFVRTITEPSLLRAFLHFILTTNHDDVVILDWLIDRVNSSTKLCMVSLSLFKTLIELNCEDIMFGLCFKYLYRLTHVMQSQRRAVKQLDIYGHIADKLLQLEPDCCQVILSEEQERLLVSYNDGIFSSGHTPLAASLREYKSSYNDYLVDAREMIDQCRAFCSTWCFIYDGEIPPHNAMLEASNSKDRAQSNPSSASKYDTPDLSLVDDVPLISFDTSVENAASSTDDSPYFMRLHSEDSPLIDISADNSQTVTPLAAEDVPLCIADETVEHQSKLSQNSATLSAASDVPLCLADSGLEPEIKLTPDTVSPRGAAGVPHTSTYGNVEPQAKSAPVDEPLLVLGDDQANFTLNILLQSQNAGIPPTLSPPLTELSQESTALSPPQVPSVDNSHLDITTTSSTAAQMSSTDQLDSFLSYLDRSVDAAPLDPDKSEEDLLQEIDAAIGQAEISVQKRKESVASMQRPLSFSAFETAEGVSALKSHPVDIGTQEEVTSASKTSTKGTAKFNLKLDSGGDNSPSIGLFMATLLNKLENMMNNSLAVNLLLTGVITRLASYSQPLLRSFLLNTSAVFHPSVKSLIQVLNSVKVKVDTFAAKVPNFNVLLLQARKIMIDKIDAADVEADGAEAKHSSSSSGDAESSRTAGKRITDFFKRDKHTKQPIQPELVVEANGYRFSNVKSPEKIKLETPEARLNKMNTKKAVFCALVLEEFVKELAALSQEHAIQSDDGYHTE